MKTIVAKVRRALLPNEPLVRESDDILVREPKFEVMKSYGKRGNIGGIGILVHDC